MADKDPNNSYLEALRSFDNAVSDAVRISRAAAGRQTETKTWWACTLFTRLCTMSISVLALAPGSRFAGNAHHNFDSGSVSSLTRNMTECYMMFFYFCADNVSEDEWQSRLNALQLHDCVSRLKMFRDFDPQDPQLPSFESQAKALRDKLKKRSYFSSLTERQKKHFLSGDHALLLNQNEILRKLGVEENQFRAQYRFLSSQTHSLPLSFSRMGEREQGRGTESEIEKGYIIMALAIAEDALKRATKDMVAIFPDIPLEIDKLTYVAGAP